MDLSRYRFTLELAVRDYEVDLQGVVNNAIYLNYLEHARHQVLTSGGINFAQDHAEGIDPVLIHADIQYHNPLRSGDTFVIATNIECDNRTRIIFKQDIYNYTTRIMVLEAVMTTMVTKNNRAVRLPPTYLALCNESQS